MLKLNRRECQIATHIPTRNENHGDKLLPAMDIVITVLLTREEMNSLLRREDADKMLFTKNGDLFEPTFGGVLGPLPMLGEFENSRAVFRVGIDLTKIEVLKAKIGKFKLDPQVGGMTSVKLMISALQTEEMKGLYAWMGQDVKVDIAVGKLVEIEKKDQVDLPLGEPAEEAAAADVEEPQKPKRVRDRSKENAKRKERRESERGNGTESHVEP